MSENRIKFTKVTTQEQFDAVVQWARSQPGHESMEFTAKSEIFAVTKDEVLVGVIDVGQLAVARMVFGVDGGNIFLTNRIFDLFMGGMQLRGINPIVLCEAGSPLESTAEHKMDRVFETTKFFKY